MLQQTSETLYDFTSAPCENLTEHFCPPRQMSHSTVRAASGGCTALSLPVGELGLLLGGSRANMDSAMRECHDVWQKDLRNLMKTRQVWQRLKDMRSMLSSLCIDISSLETLFRLPMASNPRTIPPQMSARIFGGIGRSSPAFLHLKSQVDEAVTSPVADLGKTIKLLSSAVMACLPPLKGYAANLVTAQMVLSDVPPAAAILIRNLESEAGCSLKDALCHPVSFLQRMYVYSQLQLHAKLANSISLIDIPRGSPKPAPFSV
jgi:hypothetical protein